MNKNLPNLHGKIVLITGAGRGAGKALALALAAQGAVIAANDISPVNLDPVVEQINASGGRARAFIHDIAKKVDVQVLVNNVSDAFGSIDILINSANVQLPSPLLEIDEWDLHRVFEVNAIGTLLMMQSVGRVMRAQGQGSMINILKVPASAPASFIASRAGLIAMTEQINQDLGKFGIRVLTITDLDPVPAVLAGLA
ncbi:MAG: SDR family NAD(P)-dependent oxidoreductase [Chloroflexota bacterium]